MARSVFFSFHYENDVDRAFVVRNSWVTQSKQAAGFVDKAEFEEIKKKGKTAVERWIDDQLIGTSVTVVLVGSETLDRPFVQYEIKKSIERGNAILGIQIGGIKNLNSQTSVSQDQYKVIDTIKLWEVFHGFYNYVNHHGYSNLGTWIENAAQAAGK